MTKPTTAEYNKQYYQKNREKILKKVLAKVVCSCGREVNHCNLKVHMKSGIHKRTFMNNLGYVGLCKDDIDELYPSAYKKYLSAI